MSEHVLFLIFYSLVATVAFLYCYRAKARYEHTVAQRNHQIEEQIFRLKTLQDTVKRLQDEQLKVQPRTESIELTEFLADFKTHGYSFVRVDPQGVMVRRPGAYV